MYLTSIKEIEAIVGKKAANIEAREKEIVLTFSGGQYPDQRNPGTSAPSADVRVHISKW